MLYFHPGCSGLCSFTWAAARSQLLLFFVVVLAGGVALSLYIAHDGRKHMHNPTLSARNCGMSYKFAAPRYRLPPMALQTVQVSVEARLSTATHKAEMALKDRSVVS